MVLRQCLARPVLSSKANSTLRVCLRNYSCSHRLLGAGPNREELQDARQHRSNNLDGGTKRSFHREHSLHYPFEIKHPRKYHDHAESVHHANQIEDQPLHLSRTLPEVREGSIPFSGLKSFREDAKLKTNSARMLFSMAGPEDEELKSDLIRKIPMSGREKAQEQQPDGLFEPPDRIVGVKPRRSNSSADVTSFMRSIAQPLAVVTSGPVEMDDHRALLKGPRHKMLRRLRGLLISSFNMVSADPQPCVSFNIKIPSTTWDAIEQTREFIVHLIWDQKIATDFALQKVIAGAQQHHRELKRTKTLLNELKQARMFGLRCKFVSSHKVQDHLIVVGEVLEILPGPDHEDRSIRNGSNIQATSLLWRYGQFHEAVRVQNRSDISRLERLWNLFLDKRRRKANKELAESQNAEFNPTLNEMGQLDRDLVKWEEEMARNPEPDPTLNETGGRDKNFVQERKGGHRLRDPEVRRQRGLNPFELDIKQSSASQSAKIDLRKGGRLWSAGRNL